MNTSPNTLEAQVHRAIIRTLLRGNKEPEKLYLGRIQDILLRELCATMATTEAPTEESAKWKGRRRFMAMEVFTVNADDHCEAY